MTEQDSRITSRSLEDSEAPWLKPGTKAPRSTEPTTGSEAPPTLHEPWQQYVGGWQIAILLITLFAAILPGQPILSRFLLLVFGGVALFLLTRKETWKDMYWQEKWRRRDLKRQLAFQQPRVEELESQLETFHRTTLEELTQAKEVQENLLPPDEMERPGIRFAMHYRPSVSVGGDLYDVIPLTERFTACYLADASGHGVGAALMSVMLKFNIERLLDHLKVAAEEDLLCEEVLQHFMAQLNNALSKSLQGGRFISLALVIVDSRSGNVWAVNCGHNQPIHYSNAHGDTHEWEVLPNLVLGIMAEMEFEVNRFALQPGDKIVLYTDGITERTNSAGKEWGTHNLLHIVRENAHTEPCVLVRHVILANKTFAGAQEAEDDIAVMVLEYTGSTDLGVTS
ncbi:MAG: PP2C family protein-serine/threonine phosphatase [Candidatus Sumerlaeia bacterium]|nr:PP2C family protein-serine/threonine phosphatase [Candidatus Sumerlaeia bacterium]